MYDVEDLIDSIIIETPLFDDLELMNLLGMIWDACLMFWRGFFQYLSI